MKNNALLKLGVMVLFATGMMFSCTKKNEEGSIAQVKYGTSFGECIGYCKSDLTMNSTLVKYSRSGWSDTIQALSCTEAQDPDRWLSYITELDVKSFNELPATIGCPDCADGGAEWFEITMTNGDKHKVTFEYGNEPAVLTDFIFELREMLNGSVHCVGL
jgi:hypothetical protein